jgi:hypothetical protein
MINFAKFAKNILKVTPLNHELIYDVEWMNGDYALHQAIGLELYYGKRSTGKVSGIDISIMPIIVREQFSANSYAAALPPLEIEAGEVNSFLASMDSRLRLGIQWNSLQGFYTEFPHFCVTPEVDLDRRIYLMGDSCFLTIRFYDDALTGLQIVDPLPVLENWKDADFELAEDRNKELDFFQMLGVFWEGPANGAIQESSEIFDRPPWPPQ